MSKLAVVFPGIGYTVDKPLLYFSRKIAAENGYEIKLLPYAGFPAKILGDREKMEESYRIALVQSREMLEDMDFTAYDELLFIGKSIGTAVAAQIAADTLRPVRLLLYTPLEETFLFPLKDSIVFTGLADPWVGKESSRIPQLCEERGIPCHVIPGANHSLETGEAQADLRNLVEIMEKTEQFIRRDQAWSIRLSAAPARRSVSRSNRRV